MSLNTSTALTVGFIWVGGSALIAMFVPASLTALAVSAYGIELPQTGAAAMVFFLAQAVAAITCALVTNAVMMPRWRLWSYRRVPNVSLLKRRAEEAKLAYSTRHFLGRIEWTSQRTREELQRLEWLGGTGEPERYTTLGTLLRSMQYGAILGLFATIIASQLMYISHANAVLLAVLGIGAFVWVLTTLAVYRQAQRIGSGAEEALKSLVPAKIRRQD